MFTLVEVMVTLAIIAVMAAFTVPSFTSYVDQADDHVLQAQLLDAIQFSQHAAIAQRASVFLRMEHGQLIIADQRHVLSVTTLSLNHGAMHARFYPINSRYLTFFVFDDMSNDNGSFWYCRTKTVHPVWALRLSAVGNAHVVYPDKRGDIVDAKGERLMCE